MSDETSSPYTPYAKPAEPTTTTTQAQVTYTMQEENPRLRGGGCCGKCCGCCAGICAFSIFECCCDNDDE